MPVPNDFHLADLLTEQARVRGDDVAVWFPDGKGGSDSRSWTPITFGEIDRAAHAYARGFQEAGLQPGDRTLLMVKPSADFYPLAFGLFRAGAVPVFIDPGMGLKNALRCVETIEPEAMIAIPPVHAVKTFYRRPFKTIRTPITAGSRWFWGGSTLESCRIDADEDMEPAVRDADSDAVIVFTSGSTGPAKGVSLTHRCMGARVAYIQEMLGLEAGETISETLLVYTILELCMGLTVVVPPMDLAKPATVDPADVVATMQEFDPTLASASPVVWQRLVRHALDEGIRLDGIRLLLTTAAPIPVDLHARLDRVFPATTELFTPYGATEAMPVAKAGTRIVLDHAAPLTAAGAGTCVGFPAPGIEIKILEVTDAPLPTLADATELPTGEIGEITVRGAGVSEAYRNAPEGNARAKITDGDTTWHRMGDLGYRDADGRLWFCGRKGHRVETAMGVVPAVCVEGIYNAHPDVYRTALVGLGQAGAQEAVLCVELEPGTTWSAEVEEQLAGMADGTRWEGVVSRFVVRKEFPTDARHNSKIRREDLRAQLGG